MGKKVRPSDSSHRKRGEGTSGEGELRNLPLATSLQTGSNRRRNASEILTNRKRGRGGRRLGKKSRRKILYRIKGQDRKAKTTFPTGEMMRSFDSRTDWEQDKKRKNRDGA